MAEIQREPLVINNGARTDIVCTDGVSLVDVAMLTEKEDIISYLSHCID